MNNAFNIHSAIFAVLLLGSGGPAIAETDIPHPTYTWSLTPESGDWNTPSNWMPEGIPDTISEGAVFGSSSVTDIFANAVVHSIEFIPGASQYTITGNLTFNGGGVINNSGVVQTFNGAFTFDKFGATAGSLVTFTNTARSFFTKGTNAGSATYINNDTISFSGGLLAVWHTTAGEATIINNGELHFHKADAGSATITNNGGATFGADGALIRFAKSSATFSTIINNGGAVFGGRGARLIFNDSVADSATLIANGGAGPGSGATILFMDSSKGDAARIEVFGNGSLDVSRPDPISDTVGSIEGNGLVFLGSSSLSVGSNNLNTTFAGVISDSGGVQEGTGGSLTKTGTGTLILTSSNDYSAGTTVESGSLFVNNTTGSATGSGPVSVAGGGLAGAGIITGPLTVGTGSSSGAALAPGASGSTTGTLTVQNALSLLADATYNAQLNSTTLLADDVPAAGVNINGARIRVGDLGATTLGAGTSFTLINNTSAAATIGTFSNLGDGATITIGANTYQANYEGGDGNDLTLTVVP